MNDPYHGGMHLPDIFMFVPIFHSGERRAFAVGILPSTPMSAAAGTGLQRKRRISDQIYQGRGCGFRRSCSMTAVC